MEEKTTFEDNYVMEPTYHGVYMRDKTIGVLFYPHLEPFCAFINEATWLAYYSKHKDKYSGEQIKAEGKGK